MPRPETRSLLTVARRLRIAASTTTSALILALAAASVAQAQGTVVTTFGTSGLVPLAAGTQLFGVAAEADGDVVAVGQSGGNVFVEQFTEAGAPAGTYAGPAGVARAVAIESNGDIVIAGSTGGAMFVERLTSALTPDPTFGKGGMVTAFAGQSSIANGVAIGSNGTIVAAGSADISPTVPSPEVAVADLSATGASEFAAAFNLGANSVANGVAVQSNGDIVLVGSQRPLQDTNGVIARLTNTGTLDTTFAGSGAKTYIDTDGGYTSFNAVALQSNGQIVVAGADAGGPNALLLRYGTNGTLDPSFGSAGIAAFSSGMDITVGGQPVGAYGLGIAGGGAIVAAGQFERTGGEYDATAWATDSTGAADASFGTSGAVSSPTGLYESCALAVDPDGTLIAVGNTVATLPDDAPCTVDPAAGGFLTEYTGFGPIPFTLPSGVCATDCGPPPPTYTPLTLSLVGVAAKDKTTTVAKHGLKVGVGCNETCTLKLSLVVSSGTAKRLHILTKYKKCTKVKGKERCSTAKAYRSLTLASGTGSLKASGTATTTLKLNKAYVKALEREKSVSVSLQVSGTSTAASKGASITKNLTFER
jgi:uncharacterized delta-60 repeat protein